MPHVSTCFRPDLVTYMLCRFRLGRQEDAHEYLRCVLDAMHESFLKHIKPKPPPELAATTFVQRIFGGKLRSQVCFLAQQQQGNVHTAICGLSCCCATAFAGKQGSLGCDPLCPALTLSGKDTMVSQGLSFLAAQAFPVVAVIDRSFVRALTTPRPPLTPSWT
eukprot:GHUV01053482.1.p1 GENE.GHUV01053482.1~~GHUV01053482.1.p1  ORF type:complete len:163 (+),score=38.80 GHUV01053482.1:142-630(+)